MSQVVELPEFLDESLDVDSHEFTPLQLWRENFGEEVDELLRPLRDSPIFRAGAAMDLPNVVADDAVIDDVSVWTHKGAGAGGATDMRRRMEVMDLQGMSRSLVFPTFAIVGMTLWSAPRESSVWFQFSPSEFDAVKVGRKVVETYNDWVIRSQRAVGADRLRLVAAILPDTVEGMIGQLDRFLSEGVRAVWVPSVVPPGGTSPADSALDPFWAMAAGADAAVCLHLAGEVGFLASDSWTHNVPAFNGGFSPELNHTVYGGANLHLASEHFLGCAVLGGVFERHPMLRFGAIESGGYWLGPMAERLDIWAKFYGKQLTDTLSMAPSEYLARNVRVTPFFFEDFDTYFDRYPNLQNCYCYSTDYPHTEGGKYSKQLSYEKMKRHGEDIMRKYFVTNGEWILPAAR